ncbi:heme peroxidase [Tribonema minus]|uniref:Cytochrome c peroxidase, mitochondrial n=1 Tax=Tribonema minus TaxID=303371 RepID=A0A835ZCK3_9STRA|nr:heme peroxidase [Tribonema minus]
MRTYAIVLLSQTAGARFTPIVLAGCVSAAGVSYMSLPPAKAQAVDYNAVKQDIKALIEQDAEQRGDGTSLAGTLVRLAWHASGTYCKSTKDGGSCGATMRFDPEASWGANAGLGAARSALEPIKAKYPGLSYGDLWTLAGSVAIAEMGGPTITWRPGRTDSDKPTKVPDGQLPDADKGDIGKTIDHIRAIFGRMGFSDREMVALIGAHAVGRCHTDASGYWGPWTFAETTFSNEYFRLLVEGGPWTVKRTHEGKPWTGPLQFEDPTGKLMMLPTDMAMIWDKEFRQISEEYAKDEDLFFKDFSEAWKKLIELGVTFPSTASGLTNLINRIRALFGFGAK